MPKLYKSITTSPRRAGSIKERHDRNQRQPKKEGEHQQQQQQQQQ